jgi:hypothetical protein
MLRKAKDALGRPVAADVLYVLTTDAHIDTDGSGRGEFFRRGMRLRSAIMQLFSGSAACLSAPMTRIQRGRIHSPRCRRRTTTRSRARASP